MTMRGTIHANSGEDHQKARREREMREDRDVWYNRNDVRGAYPLLSRHRENDPLLMLQSM